MWDKCVECDLMFSTHIKMINHVKKVHQQDKYCCRKCPKEFENKNELFHHITLEHIGLEPKLLDVATKSRETKKQLGDFVGENAPPGVSYECPECFEIFPGLEKLDDHRKSDHHMQLTEQAKQKLKNLPSMDKDNPPQCEKCNHWFYGLVVCMMNGKAISVCLSCYANHYGENALRRLTIGTPDNVLAEMRRPIR